ncbi:MAG: hypothetical protein OXH79_02000 [Boseongicola sp.]|nr:hypothetical protein [Boseongicola sp.]
MSQDTNFKWVTRGFVWRAVFIISAVGPTIGALAYSFLDQSVRDFSRSLLGGRDLFHHIVLDEEQFNELPLEWRQAIAEVDLRSEEEASRTMRVIRTLSRKDLDLIGRLAPFLVFFSHQGGYIAKDDRLQSEHPIPEITYEDMRKLEEIGIVDDTNFGMTFAFKNEKENQTHAILFGTTLGIELLSPREDVETKFFVTRLTEAGETLLRSLRVPSNIEYFEWIAGNFEREGWIARLFALGTPPGLEISRQNFQANLDRASIRNWERTLDIE